jgi:ABC-2 type transport system permease protein
MIVKEFLQLGRNWPLLLFILYAFTLDVYLAGSGVSLQLRNASLTIHDEDHSRSSRRLIYRFREPYFRRQAEVDRSETALDMLDRGQTTVLLNIPPRFHERVTEGRQADAQLLVDATNSVQGFLAAAYAEQIVNDFGLETGANRPGRDHRRLGPRIVEEHRVWFNANQQDSWFMSLAELFQVVTLFAILLPAASMAREKERGTVEQLLVSPITAFETMFPKVVVMTAVVVAGLGLCLAAVLRPCFGVPVRGSLALFFAVTTLYVFTTAGVGMLIATLARNMPQVGMLTILVFLPMLFLSGSWTAPEAMPHWIAAVTVILPLHHYLNVGLGIFLKGAGLGVLWDDVALMGALGAAVFAFGMWRFRRQFG